MATKPITAEEKELHRQYKELIDRNAEHFVAVQRKVTEAYEEQLKEMREKAKNGHKDTTP